LLTAFTAETGIAGDKLAAFWAIHGALLFFREGCTP